MADRSGAVPPDGSPLLYNIDTPTTTSLQSDGSIAFAGWVFSLTGRDVSVLVRGGGATSWRVERTVERPDVMSRLGLDGSARCGFGFWINMQQHQHGTRIEIEFDDGEHTLRLPPYLLEYTGVRRAHYQAVWNALTETEEDAKLFVAGLIHEGRFADEAERTKRVLLETVGVGPDDIVLEIGAGVGRVGGVIAPLCREWIGADVSEHMLQHMRRRLAGLSNVRTILLSGYDLAPIASESVDVAYCTVVFMHFDEWDRFNYLREAWRVLRPGGRAYADNFNLLSEEGWATFEHLATSYHPHQRPPQISKSSTPQELAVYFRRAGFTGVTQKEDGQWIRTYGTKPR